MEVANDFVETFKDKILSAGGNYTVSENAQGFIEFNATNIPEILKQEITNYKVQRYGE